MSWAQLIGALKLDLAALYAGEGGGGIEFTDGTHTVLAASELSVTGATIGGTSPTATLNVAAGSAANVTPDTHPASPNAVNDEFEATSLSSQWTKAYQGTNTIALNSGMVTIKGSTGAVVQPTIIYQSIVGTTWDIRCKVLSSAQGAFCGLFAGQTIVTAPSYGEGIIFGWQSAPEVTAFGISAGGGGTVVTAQAMNNTYAYDTSVLSAVDLYLDMTYDGTTLTCSVSMDGVNFSAVGSASFASYGGTPVVFGLFFTTSGGNSFASFDWFRRIA